MAAHQKEQEVTTLTLSFYVGYQNESKHLKDQLGPRVGDVTFLLIMEVSWDPGLVT